MTKSKILKWFCTRSFFGITCDNCRESGGRKCISYSDLSDRIDSLVKSCPSDEKLKTGSIKYWHGFRAHCDEVENWKKEVLNAV